MKTDKNIAEEFRKEMKRFLPNQIINQTVLSQDFWDFLTGLLESLIQQLAQVLSSEPGASSFVM